GESRAAMVAYRGLCPAREAPGRYSRQLTTAAGARGHSIPRARGADFPPPRSPAAANLVFYLGGAPPVSRRRRVQTSDPRRTGSQSGSTQGLVRMHFPSTGESANFWFLSGGAPPDACPNRASACMQM